MNNGDRRLENIEDILTPATLLMLEKIQWKKKVNSGRDWRDQDENQATSKHRTTKPRRFQSEIEKPSSRGSRKHHRTRRQGNEIKNINQAVQQQEWFEGN